ncbi:unnamed protein product, partial [Mesorhabditis spiculigera]
MAAVGLFAPRLLIQLKRLNHRDQGQVDKVYPQPDAPLTPSHKPAFKLDELICSLHVKYGFFWRLKVRFFIVFGEPEQITAIAPSLTQDHWLEGQNTVLLWGGSVHTKLDESLLAQWRALSRWRALDGVVWALSSDQSADDAAMAAGVRYLRYLSAGLRWQLPLHLWQVCDSQWPQAKRQVDAVGCRLPQKLTADALETRLAALIEPLRNAGWAQMKINNAHDFLLRLARDLGAEGIPRWCQALAPLFGQFARGVPCVACGSVCRRVGWSTPRIGYALAMSLALVWAAGLLLSYASNRALISHVQTSLTALQHSRQGDEQFQALHELTRELGRLDYRAEHGRPWHQRFGLNQNQALLDTLWPRYVDANHRLMRDPAAANLQRQLMALIQLAPDSPERASEARVAYGQLKAYLMLAHPEKPTPNSSLKPSMTPNRCAPAEQLSAHPEWRIPADPKLIAQARQVLLGQLGQRNAEASLYQQVLDASINHSPALELRQMVGATDAQALFSSDARVPGVFTRQAWEGQVSRAIDDIAEARREQIDWVLSDQLSDIASDLTPAMLKKRLTERYFDDYASAWLDFLNSLRWHPQTACPMSSTN